ncbi:MAG: serine hydroxymethyltransferase [Rhizobacter sp.]
MTPTLTDLFARLRAHEARAAKSFNLTPSENRLSPLATMPFAFDAYSRYFLDDLRLFGQWCFPAGRHLGAIERDVLHPVLKQLACSSHVNVRPISGISCMTIILAALTKPGDLVLVVPASAGGHASTRHVAARLGAEAVDIPFRNPFDIDLDRLRDLLRDRSPRLVYIDQSTLLFPIDAKQIRSLVDQVSPTTLIHYDSSHLNGLVLGGIVANPLERGADSFGGSTHKTLPGPHKGFIATQSVEISKAVEAVTDHFVSQHKMAEVTSLAITLLEFRDCGGVRYAQQTVENARTFAATVAERGLSVAGADRGMTDCHQVWVAAGGRKSLPEQATTLESAGLLVNSFPSLPSIDGPAFRLSLAEFTRMGAQRADAQTLAHAFADVLAGDGRGMDALQALRHKLARVAYCWDVESIPGLTGASMEQLLELLPSLAGAGGDVSACATAPTSA